MSDDLIESHLVSDAELSGYGSVNDWVGRLSALSLHQREHWPMMAKGHATLSSAQVRRFEFGGFEIRTQFNPGRMASAAAKVDAQSIQERKCFLCPRNLPAEQKGLAYDDYLILCNPFPILDEHFTIAHTAHRPQRIAGTFGDFIRLTRDFGSKYTLLYNGPRAGASAPDHLHFQAGTRGWMPIDNEYARVRDRSGALLAEWQGVCIWVVEEYLRPIVGIEGTNAASLSCAFAALYESLDEVMPGQDEPMLNMVAWRDEGRCTFVIFPRAKHRPACFFAEGEEKILVSPGAVDVGGVLITPLAESFERLNEQTIRQIFAEVSISPGDFARLTMILRNRL